MAGSGERKCVASGFSSLDRAKLDPVGTPHNAFPGRALDLTAPQ